MRESLKRTELFSRCRRVVIKVGSATVTGAKGLDRAMIHRLSDQIAELRGRTPRIDILVVSSGAIASGMYRMGLAERPRSIPHKQAVAAVGQGALMEAWEGAFDKYDLLVAQVLLTSEDLANRRRYLNARNTLETLLSWGITPIINENDTVVVEEIKFGDNDHLSALIAGLVGADLVVNLTDIDGLYDCNPRRNPSARLIPVVNRVDRTLLACAAPEPGSVGTGGMLSKVNAARKCLALGIPMIIAPGKQRDVILRLFAGEELGTMFVPKQRSWSGKKVWLANLPKPAGEITLDDGAVTALLEQGRSLLPIGIRQVKGVFGIGAPVRCIDREGNVIGIGLTNYKSTEIENIKGRHSDEIEALIGYKHSDEVINRDNFVLTSEAAQGL
ncbi:MAG: glutamate 5-kinase [Syntrophobacteraceae bacterium]|nr:glutamate 5-kinase [Syntrophobacteraceae bacterium]